jgi:signal transduction histidine kinase
MCRKIVEYHGGRIWLDTTAPAGRTIFRFTLPAIDEEPVPT